MRFYVVVCYVDCAAAIASFEDISAPAMCHVCFGSTDKRPHAEHYQASCRYEDYRGGEWRWTCNLRAEVCLLKVEAASAVQHLAIMLHTL